METTKICRDCGRELPIERFKRSKFGQPVSVCLDCDTRKRRENKEKKRMEKVMEARQQMLKEEEVKSELSTFNSRQLMAELARRGYEGELTKEHSTFECIKFKPIEKKRWRDNKDIKIKGHYITYGGLISDQLLGKNIEENYGLFATEKQAKSALAMARISQIMANDERFGGVVTDEEWKDGRIVKYVIERTNNAFSTSAYGNCYCFLAFHTLEQRDLFLKENEDLIRDYLML